VNAAPEVATIGQVARCVQRIAQARGDWVRIDGAAASEATFRVRSKLDELGFQPTNTLASGLDQVYDYFKATKAPR
jgi:nucleoside-diphosphate-sugar epimerase